jgi:(2Fe-2S) ferredoxin
MTETCKKKLGIGLKETTADGLFTLVEVECLGACVNAPVVQVNDDFYEDLDAAKLDKLLDDLKAGKKPAHGPQIDRLNSAPVGGATTLKDVGTKPGAGE